MLMVIFGAGASYDSVAPRNLDPNDLTTVMDSMRPNYRGFQPPFRPPLTVHLFDRYRENFGKAIDNFPESGTVINILRSLMEKGSVNLEQELEKLQIQGEKQFPPRLRHLAAFRFYLRQIIGECADVWLKKARGITNYRALLDRINQFVHETKERVCLVSFNYDTLLEKACELELGMNFLGTDSYITHGQWVLVKPHGSTNWGRLASNRYIGHPIRFMIERARDLSLTNEFIVCDPTYNVHEERLVFPAIAIPMETKYDFECPSDHLKVLIECIRSNELTRVLVIGWRATEKNFLDLWPGPRHRIHLDVVAGSPDESAEIVNRLAAVGLEGGLQRTHRGFSAYLDGEELEKFLAAGF